MSKLYKVICNAAAVECGVKIGDIFYPIIFKDSC